MERNKLPSKLPSKLLTADEVVEEIFRLFHQRGDEYYGEAITQREHALQTAALARQAGDPPQLVVACLLHDIGHLFHVVSRSGPLGENARRSEIPEAEEPRGGSLDADPACENFGELEDLLHEELGAKWLEAYFPPEITEPVRMHVAAKRYLCWRDPAYLDGLSAASRQSLMLQGGPMGDWEGRGFEQHPHRYHALRLRKYDDQGKVPGLNIPQLVTYRDEVRQWVRFRADSG